MQLAVSILVIPYPFAHLPYLATTTLRIGTRYESNQALLWIHCRTDDWDRDNAEAACMERTHGALPFSAAKSLRRFLNLNNARIVSDEYDRRRLPLKCYRRMGMRTGG
jgi:hypothetical protein